MQASAMYAIGLFRGLLQLYGSPVSVNFSNEAAKSADEFTEEETQLWDKCLAVVSGRTPASHTSAGGAAAR